MQFSRLLRELADALEMQEAKISTLETSLQANGCLITTLQTEIWTMQERNQNLEKLVQELLSDEAPAELPPIPKAAD